MISDYFGLQLSSDAGWLSSSLNDISGHKNYEIIVCFYLPDTDLCGKNDNIKYYSFGERNFKKYSKKLETFFDDVIKKEQPDIVHIFGTEYPHSLSAVRACKNNRLLDRCIISIQGLISRCAQEYYAGLPASVIYGFSLRDFLKMDNVFFQKKSFEKRGRYEIKAIKAVKNIVGRTDWDHACTTEIHPDINYYRCNESLRDSFYNNRWSYKNCEKHSIFISQGYYPLKGIHNAIKVLAEIIKKYPDAHIYTTNEDDSKKNLFSRIKHRTYYQSYLQKLIKRHNLEDKITFLGALNAEEMCERYLKSNVFLLCSSLENSSNSLGEAMILGVPCVSSDVGGIKSLINHNTEGFVYPFNEPYMINYYIDKIFSDTQLANTISTNAREHALLTHSREGNNKRLKEIYDSIISKGVI